MERANAESKLDKRSRVQTSVLLTVGAVHFSILDWSCMEGLTHFSCQLVMVSREVFGPPLY
jgi:uncharacterized membrane protein